MDFKIIELARKELHRIENEHKCEIVLAGFIGSCINGLGNEKSDFDIRAISLGGDSIEDSFFVSYNYGSICLETKIYPFDRIYRDLKEWKSVKKEYPTILSNMQHPFVHDDISRNIVRLSLISPIFQSSSFIHNHVVFINDSLSVIEALDYEYSRAYMNFHKFLCNEKVNVRKYLYTLLEIFSLHWILENISFPGDFISLLSYINPSDYLSGIINDLLETNLTECKENLFIEKQNCINKYIENELKILNKKIINFADENFNLKFTPNFLLNG